MDNKDHIVLSSDTLGTTVPEAWQNLQMSSPTLTKDNTEYVDEKDPHCYLNNCEDSHEHVQSSKYVNYYDNESYVLEHLKTEFPEDVLPQSDCSLNTQIHSENKELLEFVVKTEINDENTEDGLSLNIKQENDYNEYPFTVRTEGLEEQEDVQCRNKELLEFIVKAEINDEKTEDGLSLNIKEENDYNEYPFTVNTESFEEQQDVQYKFYHNTLNNGSNLLQNNDKSIKVEITTPLDNEITELHQCKYCGNGFDNYNNMLIHISNDHKHEKPKCDICGKQFKSVGNLNRHILAFHKLDKPLESVTENCVNSHVEFQHNCPLNDHSKLSYSGIEDEEDESENNVTRNIMNYDYGTMLECQVGIQFPSPIHLFEHQKLTHRSKIPKTKNERSQCDYCKKTFKNKWILERHIKILHFDYGRKFKCWCGKQYRTPIHLREHQRYTHRQNVKKKPNNGPDDEATASTSTDSRGLRGKNAQYYREYRARKRMEREKESLNRISDPSTISVGGSVVLKKRKSSAEYQREYRARKKAKRNNILNDSKGLIPAISTGGLTHQATNHQPTTGSSTNSDFGFDKPKRRKTSAEYQREYRARKKAIGNIEKIELNRFVSYFTYHKPIVNDIDLDISPK